MEQELDLTTLFQILLSRIHIILISALIFGLISFGITHFLIHPKYATSGTMYVYNSDSRQVSATITSSDISTSQKLVDTYIVILQSASVLNEVASQVHLGYSAEQIGKMLSATPVNNTEIFRITITHTDPEVAQTICNAFLAIAPHEIVRVVQAGAVEVIDWAPINTKPVSPSLERNIAIAACLGLILSSIVVVLVELLDTRVKCEEDLTSHFQIPLLASIPTIASNEVKK